MPVEPIGITTTPPVGQEAIGVYESDNGFEVFDTDSPYLTSGGLSLTAPVPVFDAGGPMHINSSGRPQDSLPVKGLTPPQPDGITWDSNTQWDNNTNWS